VLSRPPERRATAFFEIFILIYSLAIFRHPLFADKKMVA